MDLATENTALRRRVAELEAALRAVASVADEKVRLHTRGSRRYDDPDEIIARGRRARQDRPTPAR